MPMISQHQGGASSSGAALCEGSAAESEMFGEAPGEADTRELLGVRNLLWGDNVKEDVFRRWSQGFRFSPDEPTALEQSDGGPCAVIAPVQAFLLKILLAETPGHCFQDLTSEKCSSLLVRAACDVLAQCLAPHYKLVLYARDADEEQSQSLSAENFHRRLRVRSFPTAEEVEAYYARHTNALTDDYGVLLLLYSVIMSKSVQAVEEELAELSDPLIHATYGHGSQGLINLMLTGRAVAHVWDHEQTAGGLRLRGIDRQPEVGFLTVMEHMQYCTVGSFYKNPKHPVWVLASETHLTVLFSFEKRLASPETAAESAERIFRSFDPDGNNFISSVLLQDVLCAADLVSEPEYVDIMRRKLDAENLGIILLNAFMEEFFAGGERGTPDTFTLLHYNGLGRSNAGMRVAYQRGHAVLLESHLTAAASTPVLACLQTKWPSIDVTWVSGKPPSLN